jgi:signal transduction histidine kinase
VYRGAVARPSFGWLSVTAIDVTVVAVALVAGVGTVWGPNAVMRPYSGVTGALFAAFALLLLMRRRAPLAVAWVVAASALAVPLVELLVPGTMLSSADPARFDSLLVWPPAGPFAAYAAIAISSRQHAAMPLAAMVAGVLLFAEAMPDVPTQSNQRVPLHFSMVEMFVFRSLAFLSIATVLGLYTAARRRELRGLVERAERAERERHLLAEQARLDERSRLAAEMHDTVSHRVSLMVLQAGALKVTTEDPAVRAAAEDLRQAGCQVMEELRDTVGLLRQRPEGRAGNWDEDAAEPIDLDLAALVAQSNSVGIPTDLVLEGERPPASPVVERTLYRIVREGLTNVRKHAQGSELGVRVSYRADRVVVSLRNTKPVGPVDTRLAAAGSGTGLQGLRQCVELIGGTFRVAPTGEGGFHLQAVLPARVPNPGPGPEPKEPEEAI